MNTTDELITLRIEELKRLIEFEKERVIVQMGIWLGACNEAWITTGPRPIGSIDTSRMDALMVEYGALRLIQFRVLEHAQEYKPR